MQAIVILLWVAVFSAVTLLLSRRTPAQFVGDLWYGLRTYWKSTVCRDGEPTYRNDASSLAFALGYLGGFMATIIGVLVIFLFVLWTIAIAR